MLFMHPERKLLCFPVIYVAVRYFFAFLKLFLINSNRCKFSSTESFRELPLLHEHFLIHPTADDWTEKQSAHQKAAIILTRVLQIEGR